MVIYIKIIKKKDINKNFLLFNKKCSKKGYYKGINNLNYNLI